MSFCQQCGGDNWCLCDEPPIQDECSECDRLRAEVDSLTASLATAFTGMDAQYRENAALRAEVEGHRKLLLACKRAMQVSEERPDIHTYWGNMIEAIDAALRGGEEG